MPQLIVDSMGPIVARARGIHDTIGGIEDSGMSCITYGVVSESADRCIARISNVGSSGILVAMPHVIDLVETGRPVPIAYAGDIWWVWSWLHVGAEPRETDFEPPLKAAGRFNTVAIRGTLPPVDWDD